MSRSAAELPVVTVVTAVYNTGRFVVCGLDSLVAQTYPKEKIQHIIVDDCSTDDSVQMIKEWLLRNPGHHAELIQHSRNRGLCASLNDGLKLATGKYYAPMADDIWKPEKLAEIVERFEKEDAMVAVIHTGYDICDENDVVYRENVNNRLGAPSDDPFINMLVAGLDIHAVTTVHRTAALQEMNGFDERLSFEDLDLYLRLLNKGYRFVKLDRPLTIYRKIQVNNNSLSQQPHKGYSFASDFLKMNGSHYGHSMERDEVNAAMMMDALEIWFVSRYSKRFRPRKLQYHTIWTRFLLRLYREKRMFFSYFGLLFRLYFLKKYSPYSFRDILYLARLYFRKNIAYI